MLLIFNFDSINSNMSLYSSYISVVVFLPLVSLPIPLQHPSSVSMSNSSQQSIMFFMWSSMAYSINSKPGPHIDTPMSFSKHCFSVQTIFSSPFSLHLSLEMYCAVLQRVESFFKKFIKQRNRSVRKSGFQGRLSGMQGPGCDRKE